MEYFGTNIDDNGHYSWILNGDRIVRNGLLPKGVSFNPEELTNNLPKGEVVFYQSSEYTVIGISGSCYDDRVGAKSVFWVKEILSKTEMIQKIMQNKHALEIIAKMPFEVKWNIR